MTEKPWEEDWDVALPACTLVAWDGDRVKCGVAVPWRTLGPHDPTEDDVARFRLASAAPNMVRVLLEIEWSGCDPTVSESVCPSCGEPQSSRRR